MDGEADGDGEGGPRPVDLLERAGVDAATLERRKEAVGFDEADSRRLSALQPLLRERRQTIVEQVSESLDVAVDAGPAKGAGADADSVDPTAAEAHTRDRRVDDVARTWRTELTGLGRGEYDLDFARERATVARATRAADVPLAQYLAVHGSSYDRVFTALEDRITEDVEAALREWAEERSTAGAGGLLGGVRSAVGGGDGVDDAEVESVATLQSSIRAAVADGMADALALARVGTLDAQVASDAYRASYDADLERVRTREAALLRDLGDEVHQPLRNVHRTAGSVADSAATITDLAGAQAEEVPAAADELDDLSATIEEVAATAEEVRADSAETERRADVGLESAREAVEAMDGVLEATNGLVTVVEELEERAERIDDVAEEIGDVASRSKVLASNATAQANRDVDPGRSLELLSEEVSSFADETRSQLADIPAEVAALREVAAAVSQQVTDAEARVETGAERVEGLEAELEAITDAAAMTAGHMDEVAGVTDRQASAAETISGSVDRLARRSQQVAAETESVAAATEEQAAALSAVVSELERLRSEHERAGEPH